MSRIHIVALVLKITVDGNAAVELQFKGTMLVLEILFSSLKVLE